jgi:histone H3/H4
VAKAKAKAKKKTTKKAEPTEEILLVGSKVKNAIREAECNASADAIEGLNAWVHWLIEMATARAHANGRKTVRAHDFWV